MFTYQAQITRNQLPVSAHHATSVSSLKSFSKTFLFLTPSLPRACKIPRLNDAQTCLQTVHFLVLEYLFSILSFDGDPFICQRQKKEDKNCLRVQNLELLHVVFK